ncbi:protein-vacuolar targeting-related protein, putative [Cryptococcus deneoformans JEC21]|uniref:Protein-vacuolar targeting-related protein, putative n=1 Tax=Cryptococcus deneoformans (strain JEC21 / ATCC MYA-565) TaxID=214684 RepID=Q5KPG1_CRYD1|nr:protein-vacuolar targeting-related protein, putative [Cryptococcus neoformans var. neoformans JEC21]AAW40887.2 protein-vacuolar targeting-related protein, putative [Cryptococcus neoformans var. neoformans JEC21]
MGKEDSQRSANHPVTVTPHISSTHDLIQLPLPNTISHNNARSGASFAVRVTIGTLILLWTLFNIDVVTSPFRQNPSIDSLDDSSAAGYLRGIATKSMKWALPAPNHQLHSTYGDLESTEIGEEGIKMSLIPPKLAEKIFLDVPSNDSVAAASKRYTGYAHPAGSGYDYASALTLKNEWEKELGLRVSGPQEFIYDAGSPESQARVKNGMDKLGVWIDTYYPVMNTPVYAAATLLTDPPFHAKLREDIVDGDSDSELRDEVPVFHGLSVSGDVRGNFVYVGYGRKKDFDLLKQRGVDIDGKIVLAKYGGCFRGLKVKAAQEAGATGVIIFTDPGNDGEITEENGYEVYPKGPARQPSSVQRGSVQFLSKYPGDPSTPGEPAYKNASRLEGGNQPSIPSIPMSYEDVIPFLKALEGKGIHASDLGPDWVGGLGYHGVDYYIGPSDVDLHLVNEVNTRVMPIWNTMAVIPGHITDEVIILGNHRDAWVLGASDPNSGTASQFEVIRGLGTLLRKGWKPLRTIMLASWDAEEYGLIGSTEWAEDFGDWLQTNAAAYLNMDSSASGSNFHASASPSLALLVRSAAEEVESSSSPSKSVFDTRFDAGNWEQFNMEKLGNHVGLGVPLSEKKGSGIGALGSGSDFTPFLQRYGIASSELGHKGGPKDAVYHYHSIYDSFTWQKKFGDVGFHRHTDAAKVIGLLLLRLADGLILPLNTTQYTRDLEYYLEKVQDVSKIDLRTLEIDFEPLADAIEAAQTASGELDKQRHKALKKLHKLIGKPAHGKYGIFKTMLRGCGWRVEEGKEVDYSLQTWEEGPKEGISSFPHPRLPFPLPTPGRIREIKKVLKEIRIINRKLQNFESGFLSQDGLKDREWYKHKGTAPGLWLGYGATTFPALTEAITIDHSPKLAQKEVHELAKMINKIAKYLVA